MPRDANGNHSLVPGYLAVQGQTVQPSNHNPPLEDISSSLTGSLPRDGSAAMTAPIKLPDGTSSAPAVTFAGEPTLGFYRKAAGVLALAGGSILGVAPIGLGPLPYSLSTAPAGWVFCKGQTLLRASYPALWALAQAEITAGTSLFNVGDGSTTFGIMDCRGRVVAGRDDGSGRLTGFMSMGAAGGSATTTLLRSDLPNAALTFTGSAGAVNVTSGVSNVVTGVPIPTHDGNGGAYTSASGVASGSLSSFGTFTPSGTISSLNGGVTQTAFNNVQPTLATNMILFAGA